MKYIKYIVPVFLFITLLLFSGCSQSKTTSSTTVATTTVPFEPIVIAAVGDISCNKTQRAETSYNCKDARVVDLIKSKNPDHVFLLGDIQYEIGTTKEYEENFIPIWKDLLPISKAIIGNHDLANDSEAFFELFPTVPKNGYYTFDISDTWRVFALNTNNDCKYVKCDAGSDQYNWLEAQLQSSSDKCLIAMQHHPRDSSGAYGNNWAIKAIDNLYYTYGVSLTIAAHDHHYERIDSIPTRVVAGTGGRSIRNTGNPAPGSAYIEDESFGAFFMEVHPYHINTYFLTIDGVVHDYHTVNCVPK